LSPVRSGVSALPVVAISTAPDGFLTSDAQPEPNCASAAAVNFSRNADIEPKALSMACATAPPALGLSGDMQCQ
jgi:hypothetical protein